MSIVVSLISKKLGELRKFLDNHYFEDAQIDDDVMEWIYIYNKPEDAVNMIDMFVNNKDGFDISLWVQINDEDLVFVNENNMNMVIQNINHVSVENV
jgi:hypothetical protein